MRMHSGVSVDPTNETLTRLIRATIDFARENSSYYRELLQSVQPDSVDLENFQDIPIATRDAFTSNVDGFLTTSEFPDYIALTSGSTFGRASKVPLIFYRSKAERETWTNIVEKANSSPELQTFPITLCLLNINHGQAATLPAKGWFGLPLEKHYHLLALVETLRRRYAFRGFSERIEILVGTTNILKLLTLMCIENAVDASEFGIKLIGVGGWQITPRWRSLISKYWNVPLLEHYGLSEVPGLIARRYEQDDPFVLSNLCLGEVLELDEDRRANQTFGRLIATSFYPLSQSTPMIRYDTGDLVSAVETKSGFVRAFRLHGRRKDCLVIDNQLLISSLELNEILDSMPDISTVENPRARNCSLKAMFGWQKYNVVHQMEDGRTSSHIEIELNWSPLQHPSAAEALEKELRTSILRRFPAFAARREQKRSDLTIAFKEPGSTQFAAVF